MAQCPSGLSLSIVVTVADRSGSGEMITTDQIVCVYMTCDLEHSSTIFEFSPH